MPGGISPTSDIHLPKEEEGTKTVSPTPSPRPSLMLTHFIALAIMVIFAASGMVAIEDLAFPAFSFFYFYFLSKVAFPALTPGSKPPVFEKSRLFNLYVMFSVIVSTSISLVLPIGYIFEGIYEGDKEGIKAAAPHVFLLASQIFMEGVVFSLRFSLPVFAFVPALYHPKRIFTIIEWLKIEIAKVDEERGSLRRYFGRALAAANLAFWCLNLFGFLLPVFIPMTFRRYYGHKVKD